MRAPGVAKRDMPEPRSRELLNLDQLNPLISIPEGEIRLRDDRKKKSWEVQIRPFLLGIYPVTQDLYREVTGTAPAVFSGERNPVDSVSWLEAIEFCNLLSGRLNLEKAYVIEGPDRPILFNPSAPGLRLPTEAEWEYACRAGIPQARYGELASIAWYEGNSGKKSHPVGEKLPNPWGLYDMLGNVWEWCWDIYDPEVYGEYRVLRGGGWADPERGCLATNRRRSHPTFKIDDLGFRLAQSAQTHFRHEKFSLTSLTQNPF